MSPATETSMIQGYMQPYVDKHHIKVFLLHISKAMNLLIKLIVGKCHPSLGVGKAHYALDTQY